MERLEPIEPPYEPAVAETVVRSIPLPPCSGECSYVVWCMQIFENFGKVALATVGLERHSRRACFAIARGRGFRVDD